MEPTKTMISYDFQAWDLPFGEFSFLIAKPLHSLKLTFSHLKMLRAPKGNELVFQPSIFRCENVSFREGIQ